ncbi:MAG: hypothetical protein HFI72_07400 [Peptococcaceae bacterium]|nr:hypothetical protein [Peptococcaceae bacterium]
MKNKDDLISRGAVLDILSEIDRATNPVHFLGWEPQLVAAKQIKKLPGQMTAAEAWEIARKIWLYEDDGGMSLDDTNQVFGTTDIDYIIRAFTPEEAKAKIEAWGNRLRVGDVVEKHAGKETKAIITKLHSDNKFCEAITVSGATGVYEISDLRKTGKTIDIQSVLEQLEE